MNFMLQSCLTVPCVCGNHLPLIHLDIPLFQIILRLPPHTAPSIVTVFTSEVLTLLLYIIHCHVFICRPYLPIGLQSFGHEGPFLSYTLSHWYLADPHNIKILEIGRKMKFLLITLRKFHLTEMYVRYQPQLHKGTMRL